MSEQDATLGEFTDSQMEDENRAIAPPTELTGVPDDWVAVRLDDVAVDEEGAFVDGPFGSNLKADEMVKEGYARIIQLQNIRASEFVDTNHKYVSKEKFDELERHGAKPGDLAIAKMSEPVARACLLPEIEDQYLVVADCIKLTVDKSDHNSVFVMLAMNSEPVWKQAFARSRGSTRKRINLTQLKNVQIPSPSLEEQRKIASMLYTVDQAIQKTDEIIDQLDVVQEGLTSHLFTKGTKDSDTVTCRLGPVSTELPEHWQTAKIGDLYSDRQLGTDERGITEESEHIDLIKMGNLDFGTWDFTEVEKIDRNTQLLEEVGLKDGDLLFNTRNTPELVGKTAVWEFDREAVYDNNLLRLRFGDRISSGHYVNYYLSSRLGQRQLRGRVHGTTSVAAIYWTDLQQVEIPVPPKEEQEEIVKKLYRLDEARRRNEEYHDQFQRLKQGLMQDLLSGEVRTHDKDIELVDDVLQHG